MKTQNLNLSVASDMNKPQSLVRSLSEEHSVHVLKELVEFCVEAHERSLLQDLEHHRSAQSAVHLLSSLQRDLILKSELFTKRKLSAEEQILQQQLLFEQGQQQQQQLIN
eukprot:TRINITY_DN1298_c0_g1_i1.p1 TRINITY_DN1298_c0_g1~~TRINITY_DN1298_c0_g1_i1.p1  ORF type:complete len:110 (+),score=8.87 TRINITY_DN1298_c0_g1_i1:374-703(+)